MRGLVLGFAGLLALCSAQAQSVRIPGSRSTSPALPPIVPIPRPRPTHDAFQATAPAAAQAVAPAPSASTCVQRLSAGVAIVREIAPIVGAGGCGVTDAVELHAIWTRGGRRIALQPVAELRCDTAEAVANWVRDDVAPALGAGYAPLAGIKVAASYHCRPRNNVPGARMSQHGLGNAIDIGAFTLSDGRMVDLTDQKIATSFRQRMRESACVRFGTVLGPGSDGYHEEHIHLDTTERRRSNLCRWAVLGPDTKEPPMVALRTPFRRLPVPVPAQASAYAPVPFPRPVERLDAAEAQNEPPAPERRRAKRKPPREQLMRY